tara:strand:- start:288 stop:620 length:333 start_codon:yes stop_codon:yes gene_type:complete
MAEKEDTEKKIQQLQLIEQSIQNMLVQKQQFQAQEMEAEAALKELAGTKEAYKILGNIMVATKKEDLQKELEDKKKKLAIRIKTIEKQENEIKEKAEKTRKEVVSEMKKE